jgi:hypothetical protein
MHHVEASAIVSYKYAITPNAPASTPWPNRKNGASKDALYARSALLEASCVSGSWKAF